MNLQENNVSQVTNVGLSLAMLTEFMNKIDRVNLSIEKVSQDVLELKEHSRVLNGTVAKHNSWIDRYDIRVSTEIPTLADKQEQDSKKLYGIGMTFTVVNIIIGTLIAIGGLILKATNAS